jgi:hypothetical protein
MSQPDARVAAVGADERLSKWTRKTLNRSPPTRAKSAPVQARIVRFQAVHSGFAAPSARRDHRPNPAQPCGKRLRKAKNPGAGKRRDFSAGGISRPVHSTALPPFHGDPRRLFHSTGPAVEPLSPGRPARTIAAPHSAPTRCILPTRRPVSRASREPSGAGPPIRPPRSTLPRATYADTAPCTSRLRSPAWILRRFPRRSLPS